MTRDEFINGYMRRSDLPASWRTRDGFACEDGGHPKIALPCACGDEDCEGWAMVSDTPSAVAWHMQRDAPEARNNEGAAAGVPGAL